MKERIQKIIAARGMTSRRKAEEWICTGRVSCNGETVSLGACADPDTDDIRVDGRPLPSAEGFVYIMLHKPRGYVTTLSDEKGRQNVSELVSGCGVRVYPVGRLDMDSEGLLLMTNDGEAANALMHPRHRADKVYEVWVCNYDPGASERLVQPMSLDGYLLSKPGVRCLWADGGKAKLLMTIHEGRNRQIRRMCQNVGLQVTRLRRIAEGGLQLGDLKYGQWRYLTEDEIQRIRRWAMDN